MANMVKLCEENNVRLVFLPPKSTHFLQPLDVAVYGPLKKVWRSILASWKQGPGASAPTLSKWHFPKLLLELMQQMDDKWMPLSKAGFRATGIYPFNADHVLSKMRRDSPEQYPRENVSENLLAYLKAKRESSYKHRQPRSKVIKVPPGQSLAAADFSQASTNQAPRKQVKRKRKNVWEEDEDAEDDNERNSDHEEEKEDDQDDDDKEQQEDEEQVDEDLEQQQDKDVNVTNLPVRSYVLVKFTGKKTPYYYVAQLLELNDEIWKVRYLRKQEQTSKTPLGVFYFKEPEQPEICDLELSSHCSVAMCLKVDHVNKNRIGFRGSFGNLCLR